MVTVGMGFGRVSNSGHFMTGPVRAITFVLVCMVLWVAQPISSSAAAPLKATEIGRRRCISVS
jgi:hypothetical protein